VSCGMSGSCGSGIMRPSTPIVADPGRDVEIGAPFSYIRFENSCIVTMVDTLLPTRSIRRGHPQHFFEGRDSLLQLVRPTAQRLSSPGVPPPVQVERPSRPRRTRSLISLLIHHFVEGDPPRNRPAAILHLPCGLASRIAGFHPGVRQRFRGGS